MEENTILVRRYAGAEAALAVNEREIWRYAGGARPEDEGMQALLDEVISETRDAFDYRVCYRRMAELPFGRESAQLANCLAGSGEVVLFAATVGLEADRRVARYQRTSPTKALLAQAFGAERAEALCDAFCADIRKEAAAEGKTCTPRFSPGYGDLPLETQRDVFRLLDCGRKIGVWLNESLLMTPTKSVTAVFGLKEGQGDWKP